MVKPDGKIETINVGMVGHIDHGKTTLLQKLSGKWASTHSEELKRGITIKLGYADIIIHKDKDNYNIKNLGTPVRHASFVDAPGHEMLMATMLSGAAMIDAAILVIASNEGIKPQTIEHLIALQAKKITHLIVAQSKIDLVDEEQARKNYLEIKQLLKGRYDSAPIIPVSAQQEVNIDKILEAICEINIPKRNLKGYPIFVIARSFDINRPGTVPKNLHGAVLGGALKQGILNVGDNVEIKPGRLIKEANKYRYEPIRTKVASLFRGSQKLNELTPGGSMSIETELDMSLGKSDLLAGNVLSIEGKLPQISSSLKLKYSLFPEVFGLKEHFKVDNLKSNEMLMLSVNTSITGGLIRTLRNNEAEIDLKVPVVPFKNDNVGIARNINGHWRLIGFGEII